MDKETNAALNKVQGTVPVVQGDQTFTKDATPDHELSEPKDTERPEKIEETANPEEAK